jgi:hypothetical protein
VTAILEDQTALQRAHSTGSLIQTPIAGPEASGVAQYFRPFENARLLPESNADHFPGRPQPDPRLVATVRRNDAPAGAAPLRDFNYRLAS